MPFEVTQFVRRISPFGRDACVLRPRWFAYLLFVVVVSAACDNSGVYLGSDVVDAGAAGAHDAGARKTSSTHDAGTRDAGPASSMRDAGSSCPAGSADCDHNASNGCETDLMHDREHCGSCAVACQSADCVCQNGALAANCSGTRADCNADPSDGCEVDLASDTNHCGSCDKPCMLPRGTFDAFGAKCSAGVCMINCEPGMGDCDGDPTTGCEVSLFFDNRNCGACGMVCNCNFGRCM